MNPQQTARRENGKCIYYIVYIIIIMKIKENAVNYDRQKKIINKKMKRKNNFEANEKNSKNFSFMFIYFQVRLQKFFEYFEIA